MDLSALIFVALAVAWAVYLVPKALKHHDEVVRSRSVERFSASMRVLARREPVNRRDVRLVVTPGRKISIPLVHTKASAGDAAAGSPVGVAPAAPAAPAAPGPAPAGTATGAGRRTASAVAARRRRRVLGVVLLALAVVAGLAGSGVIGWVWTAIPGGLLVAWLVACRLMVRSERRARAQAGRAASAGSPAGRVASASEPVETPPAADAEAPAEPIEQPVAETPAAADPNAWDMVPATLPTYVSKPAAARRTVQTIDLDSTGVWSSGRNAGDSALAREAEEVERAARDAEVRRAAGS